MKYEWVQRNNNEWRILRVREEYFLTDECVGVVYRHRHGWRGILYNTLENNDAVLFLEPTNLVDMKLLLQTTVALRG